MKELTGYKKPDLVSITKLLLLFKCHQPIVARKESPPDPIKIQSLRDLGLGR